VIKIITSGAFAAALEQILPIFSKKFNVKYKLYYGSSFGPAEDSIPSRIKKGENFDIFFLADGAINRHAEDGILDIKSKNQIISSNIGIAIKKGSKLHDVSNLESFKKTLIEVKSIALAASASGIYLNEVVFPKIFDNPKIILNKSVKILSERVGKVISRGEREIGFQQLSELLPIKGIVILGMLPIEIRKSFIFGSAKSLKSRCDNYYDKLLCFIRSNEIKDLCQKTGVSIL